MNRKYLFAGLVSFAALPCFGEVPMEISLLMKDGEFAKADSVIGKSGVSLTAVEADSLRAIGDLAFAGTDLEEVTLPARCSIHPSAFHSHVKIHRMPE